MTNLQERIKRLETLLAKVGPLPEAWSVTPSGFPSSNGAPEILPLPCSRWEDVRTAWRRAFDWRQELDDSLSVMLAVSCSTMQSGNDQLFLQVIGDAGSGKSNFCKGMAVSRRVHTLRHLTGFHSGWKVPGDPDKDCSLIARINGKTLVTPEGDVLMSSPRFAEIMSQQRQIFDGESGASYKNTDTDKEYLGLRTPWIMAGTPALLDSDQSRLGDRFLKVIIAQPTEDEIDSMLDRCAFTAFRDVRRTVNCTHGSMVSEDLLMAYRLTGGYVDWLRENVERMMERLEIDEAEAGSACRRLARFTADMRARPHNDARKLEVHEHKELPTRLAKQFARLAACLAVTLNRRSVDADVMRRVRKVALDTGHGRTLTICRQLFRENASTSMAYQAVGASSLTLATLLGEEEVRTLAYLRFLRKIKVMQSVNPSGRMSLWKLTDRVEKLWKAVMGDA